MERAARNISSRFMYHWILRFGLVSLLGSALLMYVLKRSFSQELGQDYGGAFLVLKNIGSILLPMLSLSAFFYVIVVSTLVIIIVLYLTHSIAGPLLRLEQIAEHIKRGDFTCSASPGGRDQLAGLLSEMEKLQEHYSEQLRPLKGHLDAIDAAWKKLDSASAETYDQAESEALSAIGEHLGQIKSSLDD